MINDADFDRIARWASGELDALDADVTSLWIQQDPERVRLAEAFARISDAGTQWNAECAIGRWRAATVPACSDVVRAVARQSRADRARCIRKVLVPRATSVRWSFRAAAVLAFTVGSATLLDTYGRREPVPEIRPLAVEHVTRQGERANVTLADGSTVILAPSSRLRVAPDFGAHRRELYLEGEAVFHVAHDARRPFTVFTADAVTRDIGTVFGIRAYSDDPSVRVAVREGAVLLSGAGRLGAGDIGRISTDGHVRVSHHANVDRILGWTRGEFAYEDAPLGQVLGDLRRWRGVDVTARDTALLTKPFTGSLNNMRSGEAIDLVAAVLGLHVRRSGGRFILEPVPSTCIRNDQNRCPSLFSPVREMSYARH